MSQVVLEREPARFYGAPNILSSPPGNGDLCCGIFRQCVLLPLAVRSPSRIMLPRIGRLPRFRCRPTHLLRLPDRPLGRGPREHRFRSQSPGKSPYTRAVDQTFGVGTCVKQAFRVPDSPTIRNCSSTAPRFSSFDHQFFVRPARLLTKSGLRVF